MLITSKKRRDIVYANTFAEKQYETTQEEILGLPIDILYTYENQKDDILEENDLSKEYPDIIKRIEKIMLQEHETSELDRFKFKELDDV